MIKISVEELDKLNKYYSMVHSSDEEMVNLGVQLFCTDYGLDPANYDLLDVRLRIATVAYQLGYKDGKKLKHEKERT